MGLLTTNILLINEFPDMESDQKTHKNHLVVTFGKENSRWIYLFILVLSILFTYILATKIENTLILISLGLLLIYGGYIFSVLYKTPLVDIDKFSDSILSLSSSVVSRSFTLPFISIECVLI